MSNSTQQKPALIARDLISCVVLLDQYIKDVYDDPMQAMRDTIVLNKMKKQCDNLFAKIEKHLQDSPSDFRAALQREFTYPSRFNKNATLEIILTFLYGIIQRYESELMFIVITAPGHISFAQHLVKTNRSKIKSYLKPNQ